MNDRPVAAIRNLEHAIENRCKDPDCEIHHPEVIEDEAERLTDCAMFYAGMMFALEEVFLHDANPQTIRRRLEEQWAREGVRLESGT